MRYLIYLLLALPLLGQQKTVTITLSVDQAAYVDLDNLRNGQQNSRPNRIGPRKPNIATGAAAVTTRPQFPTVEAMLKDVLAKWIQSRTTSAPSVKNAEAALAAEQAKVGALQKAVEDAKAGVVK